MLNVNNAPHIVLGLRSDAGTPSVTAAFAKAAKRIKGNSSSPFTTEDLTAALSKLEVAADREHSWYALPSDPDAIQQPLPVTIDGTEVRTVADVLAIASTDDTNLAAVVIAGALEAALTWDWASGIELSKAVLRLSRDEQLRDEALNIAAACYCMTGDNDKAVDALKHAVQGEWNLGLQTNLAIVATSVDPSLAAEQMRFLIDGAENGKERLAAAVRAIGLWRTTQEELTGSSDTDDHADLPETLLSSIRRLLGAQDLEEQDFFILGKFLAETDGTSLLRSDAFSKSPHRTTPSGELIKHRAEGFGDFLNNVVTISRQPASRTRPWIAEEVEDLIQAVLGNLASDNNAAGAAIGFNLLEQGIDCSTRGRLLLHGLTTIAAASGLDEGEALNESFIGWMLAARRALRTFNNEDDEFLQQVTDHASRMLAAQYHDQIAGIIRQLAPAVGQVQHQMGGALRRMAANRSAVAEVSRTVVGFTSIARPQITTLLEVTVDAELRTALRKLGEILDEFQNTLARYT